MTQKILMLVLTSFFFGAAFPQVPKCLISYHMDNRNRHVHGEVAEECGWEGVCWHSPPYGNWGVDSNVGSRQNGDQFQGVFLTGGHYQWNSCTQGQWEAPSCSYYNYNGCTEQFTVTGTNNYGGGFQSRTVNCPWLLNPNDEEYRGGCRDLNTFTVSNNFMSLYELDPGPICGADDFVQTLFFNNTSTALDCDAWGCGPSVGSWVSTTGYIASAQIRVNVEWGALTDDDLCWF